MDYLTLDLPNGNLVLSDNSVWKSLHTWLDGGTLYSDYYDASNTGDYWKASEHWINIDSSSTYLSFTIEYDFVNASATDSCLCQIKYDGLDHGIAVTVDSFGLIIQSATSNKHIDCDYSNANIKIDIVANLLTKVITTYIHKNNAPLIKVVNDSSSYTFTKFVIQAGALGADTYTAYKLLPTTTKLLNVSVSDDDITYSDFTETINYVDKLGLSEIWANIKNYIAAQLLGKSNVGHSHALESLSTNSIPFHNSYPRCKFLGTTITDAQNTAIKNRTYNDLFIGDYWTINGVNWRIVAIDYYYNVGDTNFNKGNLIVMPDTVLYSAQMNSTNTTAGAYAGSLMRTQNLNSARTIAQNAFGSHLANHRILLANSVDSSGPSDWAWYDSDGVELPNEVQIYGTRVWGSALKGFDVGSQKQQFPLLALAPQFVNIRQTYWLQDVSSTSVSDNFANVSGNGYADAYSLAFDSLGVRPSVTLSYI